MTPTHYETLGVASDATQAEIKKSYRRLAMRFHPDQNDDPQATAIFKAIAEAYGVIGDETRRAEYDANLGFATELPRGGDAPAEGRDREVTVEVSLGEVFVGTSRSVARNVLDPCGTCGGTGVRHKAPCRGCGGSGKVSGRRMIAVTIPAGVEDGMKLRVRGAGDPGADGTSGNLYVTVRMREHPNFVRNGADLETRVVVDLPTLALGGSGSLGGLGDAIPFRIAPGTQPGEKIRLKGCGLPRLNGRGRGDMNILIETRIPSPMTTEQKKLFERLAMTLVPAERKSWA